MQIEYRFQVWRHMELFWREISKEMIVSMTWMQFIYVSVE